MISATITQVAQEWCLSAEISCKDTTKEERKREKEMFCMDCSHMILQTSLAARWESLISGNISQATSLIRATPQPVLKSLPSKG